MNTTILISGQILIDVIILILLAWLIKISSNQGNGHRTPHTDLRIHETLVREMQEIAVDLDKNLKQKQTLSHDILSRLDDGIAQVETYIEQIEKINAAYGQKLKEGSQFVDRVQTRSSVQALISKGCSKEEVARHLGISLGEIDLLLKLHPNTVD